MWFPQMASGAAAQYPVRRIRQWRRIENELESGERIRLSDEGFSRLKWDMSCHDLSDAEVAALKDLFTAAKGAKESFGFADPLANLLAWSEDLAKPEWQSGLLTCAGGAADPMGQHRGWSISNPSGGEQSVTQTLELPGTYVTCFSVWLRSQSNTTAFLFRDGTRVACAVGPVWKRVYVGGVGSGESATFGIAIGGGASLEAFGFQVDPQPYAAQYKSTRASRGIYRDTRFDADELTFINTAPGRTSCEMSLISRV